MPHSFIRKNETMIEKDILEYPEDTNINTISEEKKSVKEKVKRPLTEEEKGKIKKKRARRRRRFRIFVWTILILLLCAAVTLDIMLYSANKQQQQEITALTAEKERLASELNSGEYISQEEVMKKLAENSENVEKNFKDEVLEMFENGDGVLTILENVYSEKIVVPDNSGYYFFDIDEKLKKHGLDFAKFEYPVVNEETGEEEGEINYVEEGVTLKRGIDVSKFQGDIDWKKVKNDGVEFAIIRCGYRGYETGKMVEDEKFEANIRGCNEVGLDAGVYFFTEAISEKEAREEADFVIDLLKEYEVDIQLPIVIDLEQSSNPAKSRTTNISQEDRTKIVIAFCERVKEAGYEPMIYGNLKSHMRMSDIYQLEDYPKWFAYYRTPLRYPYKFDIWQYSATGSVDGIKGDVDMNIAFIRESQTEE